ncbi:RHS repeat domain-containing protein [Chryseobacterium sp. SIMBA_038]|uniref:RHS repeat domain-containing protein n=3 Tax=Bacteria TaxID=2 RepID=UPI00397A05AD
MKKVYKYSEDSVFKQKTTEYLDGFQYEVISTSGDPLIKFVSTSEGYFNFENNKYIYNYVDHLGNVRLSFLNNGSGAEVLEENNYYPFGLKHEGYNVLTGNPANQYKELQEFGMYDYGARFYMRNIGRWGVVDPLSEKGYNFSPYNYAINNPIRFIDPDGMWISITDGQNQYRYSNGQTQHQVDGKWQVIDSSVTLSDNVRGIVAGLYALENGGDIGKDLVSYFDNAKHDVNLMYSKGEFGAGKENSDPYKIRSYYAKVITADK